MADTNGKEFITKYCRLTGYWPLMIGVWLSLGQTRIGCQYRNLNKPFLYRMGRANSRD